MGGEEEILEMEPKTTPTSVQAIAPVKRAGRAAARHGCDPTGMGRACPEFL